MAHVGANTISVNEALRRLREGNKAFVAGNGNLNPRHRPTPGSAKQNPFAIILGCSDSRVPAEIVFNQGLGDLFVIRVAGNIIAPSLVGSVEFAAANFGTRLVVVLGHTHCGAVEATLDQLVEPADHRSPNLAAIIERIRPAVEPVLAANPNAERDALVSAAVTANIHTSVNQLRHGSAILAELVEHHDLAIVGAEYSLETGLVEFLD